MKELKRNYRVTIGLEIHAQLKTQSKVFSADPNRFGEEPNTMVSPISLGHPGTLPMLNREVVDAAVRMGLACGSRINRHCHFERKNYFYPDLPKGYQITQRSTPICTGGAIPIRTGFRTKQILLQQIQIEEDSGKSVHREEEPFTRIDLNRAGVPLLEIVTQPVLRSAQEAHAFVKEMRRLLRYLDLSDANMEEGSLRCDANISVHPWREAPSDIRTEIKNINSMNFVKRALEYEIIRQSEQLDRGIPLQRETRRYSARHRKTFPLREKEDIQEYRYFPEPDLPPLELGEEEIRTIGALLPQLPWQRETDFTNRYGLSPQEAELLTESRALADYFEQVIRYGSSPKSIANWLLGPIRSFLKTDKRDISEFSIPPFHLAKIIELVESGMITNNLAINKLFPAAMNDPHRNPEDIVREKSWDKTSNSEDLIVIIQEIITNFPNEVENFRTGKEGLIAFFMGEVMKATLGKADPRKAREILLKFLKP